MNEIERFIHDHKHPIMKVDIPGTKLFFRPTTEEFDFIENSLRTFSKVLSHSRVEKRCARIQADWLDSEDKARVKKIVKGLLQNFGYQDKHGIFLFPEEALFLLETNRLELQNHKNPMSVQEGYTFLLKSLTWKLEHYRIYKKLLLHSFRIMRYSTLLRKQDKIKDKNVTKEQSALPVKRKIAEKDPLDHSKRQCHGLDNEKVCIQPRQEIIKQLFADMQKTAPKIFNGNLEVQNPDYCVFLPNNKSRVNYDLDLDICMDDLITKAIYSGDKPRLYGICTGDNIAYYKLINISLPHI